MVDALWDLDKSDLIDDLVSFNIDVLHWHMLSKDLGGKLHQGAHVLSSLLVEGRDDVLPEELLELLELVLVQGVDVVQRTLHRFEVADHSRVH